MDEDAIVYLDDEPAMADRPTQEQERIMYLNHLDGVIKKLRHLPPCLILGVAKEVLRVFNETLQWVC